MPPQCEAQIELSRIMKREGCTKCVEIESKAGCRRFRFIKMKYTDKGATLSACGKYRYSLWREWSRNVGPNWKWFKANGMEVGIPKSCLFIMLNPSTADGNEDVPTIRRCVGFAQKWDYQRLEVVNLFAYRATKPIDLLAAGNAVHDPRNKIAVEDAARRAGIIICAWGANGV